MNQLITTAGQPATMSSLELVDFINEQRDAAEPELRHDHFMVKVPKVLGESHAPKFLGTQVYGNNNTRPIYKLPKREACLMAMSYSYELQAKVFDRMTALEEARKPKHPAELSRMDILKLAMESEEARIKAEAERDEAIRTKALIGSKREATAMATAAAKSKEVNRLKHELGRNQLHATVKAVKKMTGIEYDWRELKKHCKKNGLDARNVADEQYGSVKAWPATAWRDVHDIDLGSLFPMR